jgi:hypothetical protein
MAICLPGPIAKAAPNDEPVARLKDCESQEAGYEGRAVVAFWGDTAYMTECLPPDPRTAEALKIFAEIRPNGTMGQLEIEPNNAMAQCIAKHVRGHKFPKPSATCVLKISLSFKP